MFAVSPDFVGYRGRTRLIQAAWDALVATSAADLTLARVARDTGVSPQAVHKHFPNKAALLAEVAGAGLATLLVNLDPSSEPTLEEFITAWVRFASARPRHYALMFSTEFQREHGVLLRREGLEEHLADTLRRELRAEPRGEALVTAFALIHGTASLAGWGVEPASSRQLAQVLRKSAAATRRAR